MNPVYHNRFYAMGTRLHLVVPDLDAERGDCLFQTIQLEVSRIEAKLSRFVSGSALSRLNHEAKSGPVKVDDELYTILRECQSVWEQTDGAFDPTLRPLMDYWNREPETPGNQQEFARLKAALGMDQVILDDPNRTIAFANESVEIDLGGYGKGYALYQIQKRLNEASIPRAFISFGESSILAVGSHPAGDSWRIGMNDYLNPGHSTHVFHVKDASVSTSSNFFLSDDGTLNNHKHVIDPSTGMPFESFASVSVVAQSPVLAEMMSTAFLVSPDDRIQSLLNDQMAMEVIKVNYESGRALVTKFQHHFQSNPTPTNLKT